MAAPMISTSSESGWLQHLKNSAAATASCSNELSESLSVELRLSDDLATLRVELRGQAAPLTDTLLEPRLRSFVLLANQTELDDDSLARGRGEQPHHPAGGDLRDEDVARFDIELRATAASYRRVLGAALRGTRGHAGWF